MFLHFFWLAVYIFNTQKTCYLSYGVCLMHFHISCMQNAPTQSLLSVVNGILDESVERKIGEIPHVWYMMKYGRKI